MVWLMKKAMRDCMAFLEEGLKRVAYLFGCGVMRR